LNSREAIIANEMTTETEAQSEDPGIKRKTEEENK
jgi:hypothetical protein